jgi:hypothetical protein
MVADGNADSVPEYSKKSALSLSVEVSCSNPGSLVIQSGQELGPTLVVTFFCSILRGSVATGPPLVVH